MRACDVGSPEGGPQVKCTGRGPQAEIVRDRGAWHRPQPPRPACRPRSGAAVRAAGRRCDRHGRPMLLPLGPTMTLAALVQTVLGLLPLAPGHVGATRRACRVADRGRGPRRRTRDRAAVVAPAARRPRRRSTGSDPRTAPGCRVTAGSTSPRCPATPCWQPARDSCSGRATSAGRGVVSVLHGDGSRTTYEPVAPQVAIGDEVAAGGALGAVSTGASHCGGRALLPALGADHVGGRVRRSARAPRTRGSAPAPAPGRRRRPVTGSAPEVPCGCGRRTVER